MGKHRAENLAGSFMVALGLGIGLSLLFLPPSSPSSANSNLFAPPKTLVSHVVKGEELQAKLNRIAEIERQAQEAQRKAEQKALAEKQAAEKKAQERKEKERQAQEEAKKKAEQKALAEKRAAEKKAQEKLQNLKAPELELSSLGGTAESNNRPSAVGESARNLASERYEKRLKEHIQNQWKAPKNIENLSTSIRIEIDKQGNIRKIEITKSSGNILFDNSVLDAIKKSAPLLLPEALLEKEIYEQGIVITWKG